MKYSSLARLASTRALWLLCLCVTLSACARLGNALGVSQTEAPYYRPPTAAASQVQGTLASNPAETPTPASPVLSPTPSCSNNLTFIEDQTIPDGTLVQPGEALDKRWLVENSGTCNWDVAYRLKLIAGSDLGVSTEQTLYPALSGRQASIRLVFRAPDQPDTYRSAWQAYTPNGEAFGDPIFIEVQVTTP